MKRQVRSEAALTLVMMVLVGSVLSHSHQNLNVSLSHMSTLYLPTYAQDGSMAYSYGTGTVEQLTVHPPSKLIYGVGSGVIHIIDASDVNNLTSKDYVLVPDVEMTDVEVCGEAVFISYRNSTDKLHGGVRVYRTYNAQSGDLTLLHDIPLGSLPDMVKPTSDCTLVVALENEGFVQGGEFYDPPGGVGIIRFPSGIDAQPEVKTLDFTKFDDQFEQLSTSGVRWVYRDHGSNFSNNVEPEYVAFNHDYSKAYICLQENNAIAVVDLSTDTITDIHGLGFKQWGSLDPSDRDGGIHIAPWPVYGMYQPDSIRWVTWNNEGYLITANEGDAQEYPSPFPFTEEIRGKDFADSDIADSVSNDLRLALLNTTELGRLTFSKVDGKNSEGKFEQFYAYGARGISIWRTSDMVQVFDSGSKMEMEHAQRRPDIFNSNTYGEDFLSDSVDARSDNKGPETESLATGVVEDHLLIFAGNERPGTIAVFSVAPGGMSPQFQTLFAEGIRPQGNLTWEQMYDARELYGIDPEYIEFLPVSDGLADYPALLVAGSVSGTVSVLKVEVEQSSDSPTGVASAVVGPGVLMLIVCCLFALNGRFHGQL